MRKTITILLLFFVTVSCADLDMSRTTAPCRSAEVVTPYDRAGNLQAIMDKYTALGVSGVSIAIKTPTDVWEGASGYASIEESVKMQPCHLQYSQSVSKTFIAVLVMMLKEEGKVDLDVPITKYLPSKITNRLSQSDRITVRMLMNHSSGIYDYVNAIPYVADQLSNLDKVYSTEQFLEYAYDRPLDFPPGTKCSYSNTNYELLALLVNEVSGRDHAKMITERIFAGAKMTNSHYDKTEPDYLKWPNLVNSYFDRRSDGRLENITFAQLQNQRSMIGDDGVVAPPIDFIRFLSSLVNGLLVSETSFKEMCTWQLDKNESKSFGLGLGHVTENGVDGFGHSGSGIGSGCTLRYFPSKDIYIFLATNTSTFIPGPTVDLVLKMKNEIMAEVLR